MKKLISALFIGASLLMGSIDAHCQLLELLGAAASAQSENDNKSIMWYDSANDMKIWKVGDARETIYGVNSNYKMVREFTYDGKPGYILFRNGKKTGNEIGLVELHLDSDKDTDYDFGFPEMTSLIHHDLGAGKEFYTIKISIYDDGYDLIKEYRIDNNTANFILGFLSNKRFYKNASNLKYERTNSADIPAPYKIESE